MALDDAQQKHANSKTCCGGWQEAGTDINYGAGEGNRTLVFITSGLRRFSLLGGRSRGWFAFPVGCSSSLFRCLVSRMRRRERSPQGCSATGDVLIGPPGSDGAFRNSPCTVSILAFPIDFPSFESCHRSVRKPASQGRSAIDSLCLLFLDCDRSAGSVLTWGRLDTASCCFWQPD
jgi:hypothetical protein